MEGALHSLQSAAQVSVDCLDWNGGASSFAAIRSVTSIPDPKEGFLFYNWSKVKQEYETRSISIVTVLFTEHKTAA